MGLSQSSVKHKRSLKHDELCRNHEHQDHCPRICSLYVRSDAGTTTLHSLSALLEHPEFQRGLAEADEAFLEAYEPAPLTEEEMVEEIEMNIGRWVTERAKILDRVYGYPPSSYLCNLGFVVGMINKGLTYAQ